MPELPLVAVILALVLVVGIANALSRFLADMRQGKGPVATFLVYIAVAVCGIVGLPVIAVGALISLPFRRLRDARQNVCVRCPVCAMRHRWSRDDNRLSFALARPTAEWLMCSRCGAELTTALEQTKFGAAWRRRAHVDAAGGANEVELRRLAAAYNEEQRRQRAGIAEATLVAGRAKPPKRRKAGSAAPKRTTARRR